MAEGTAVATAAISSAMVAAAEATAEATEEETPPECAYGNDYDGQMGLRISAIFVILVGSLFGALFPIWARYNKGVRIPSWAFFIAKYFGSGVIVATAFIHLLAPAHEALSNECLTGPITEYPWVEGISLMTVFILFFIELMAMHYDVFAPQDSVPAHDHGHGHSSNSNLEDSKSAHPRAERHLSTASHHTPGEDHLSHSRAHLSGAGVVDHAEVARAEAFAAQMTAIFILEFGVIFHSIFVGLTLAVAGDEFRTLYIVLVFHQTFEGLGLGSRLAVAPWPRARRWVPYALGAAYALSTPIAIAVGLGVREAYAPGSQTALIANGVFDSISAGILIYTGLVELMAHEFMFSQVMQGERIRVVLTAFGVMCLGAGLMALLGKWA